jgi:hypothetical protein
MEQEVDFSKPEAEDLAQAAFVNDILKREKQLRKFTLY